MRYRAILIPAQPPAIGDIIPKAEQVYGEKIETIRRWAAKALEDREGAKVEIYVVAETLVETLTAGAGMEVLLVPTRPLRAPRPDSM